MFLVMIPCTSSHWKCCEGVVDLPLVEVPAHCMVTVRCSSVPRLVVEVAVHLLLVLWSKMEDQSYGHALGDY